MIVTTAQLFKHAYGKYAVGAYNINNMPSRRSASSRATSTSQAPFIIQLSKGARKYANARVLEGLIRAVEGEFPDAIFAVHLDHGDEQTCYDCIDSGFFSSVMIDASHEPFEENVAITRRVVERAHAKGLSVESELGKLGGVEEDIQVDEKHAMLTDPDEAKLFRGAERLRPWPWPSAPATAPTSSPASRGCTFDRIEAIQAVLPGFPLVMHGSSSVPQDEVLRINAAGGQEPVGQGRR
jgi:fructose-bisphosphate aldolase class II